MDLAFASLAKIRILLLPVGSVTQSTLQHWQDEFRTFEEIRLSDIPADGRDERARFMPSPLASGSLHLTFTSHPQSPARAQLDLFRPSDFVLGVVGIASCSQSDSLSTIYSQFTGSLAELFPLNSMFPLAQNCFIFEEGDGNTNLNVGNHLPGLVVIPSMMGNKKLYVGTLLAELCSNILGEFSLIVKSLESSLGSDSLSSGLFARLPEYKSSRHQLSASYASDDTTSISAPDLAGPSSSIDHGKLSMKRASTLNPSAIGQQSRNSTIAPAQSKPRQSMASSGSAHARLYKILGDLFLLAGRTMDASIWYSEAVHQLTRPQDIIWLAASLEGTVITAVVDAWGSNRSFDASETKEIWLEHSEKLARAASLYSQAADIPGGDQYLPELSSLYIEACLRHASLLFSIWRAGGWNDLCFTLLRGKFDTSRTFGVEAKSIAAQSRLFTPISGISRSEISGILVQVHGPWLLHLSHRERIEVLSRVSSLYADMRYKRREAYIMREIMACLMDLVVQGRDELRNAAKFQGVNKNTGQSEGHAQEDLGIREGDSITGNDSLLRLVKYICNIHSVDLDTVTFDESGATSENIKAAPHGWTDLQVGLVREAIAVAEALPDHAAVILLALSALRSLYKSLDADDQYHFFTTAARALATIRRRGDERKLVFWPEEIVTELSLVPLPWGKTPIERPLGDLKQQSELDREKAGRVDPFLYNPRQSVLSKDTIAIANEDISFLVQLENPYSFVLEILSITLSTSGVPFECNSVHLELQPNSSELVTLTGKASSSGMLTVRGCFIQLPGTKLHESLVPILTEEEEQKRILKAAADINEADRTKYTSLSERLSEKRDSMGASSGRNSKSILPPKYFTLKVIPEQPSMSIRRTSLTNGAVMLYEGETTTVYLVIENSASLPVDFLELSFDDSLKEHYTQLLGSDEISAFEKYEAEYTLVHKPVFSSVAVDESSVNPGEERVLAMRCFGKAHCTEGIIQVSYAYAQRKGSSLQEPSKSFYTRRLVFPVIVSVFEVLECSSMNILPLSTLKTNSNLGEWQNLFKDRSGFDWCALTLDIQNIYGLAFEVTLSYDQQISTTKVIPPGATYRFLIPVKRVRLQETEIEAPIPSLTQRQFVVSGLASSEENIQRELFWYREDLLNKLDANWKETGGMRNGELSLRRQRFTLPMLEAYKVEDVQIRLSLANTDGDDDALSSCPSPVAPNEAIQVSVEIVNTTSSVKTLAVSIDIDPAWNVIHSGLSKNIPIGDLESQGKVKQIANFVFMAQGRYTIQAKAFDALSRHDITLGKSSFEVVCKGS